MEPESYGRFKVSAAPVEDSRTAGRFRSIQVRVFFIDFYLVDKIIEKSKKIIARRITIPSTRKIFRYPGGGPRKRIALDANKITGPKNCCRSFT
jgi:hypothetical protein